MSSNTAKGIATGGVYTASDAFITAGGIDAEGKTPAQAPGTQESIVGDNSRASSGDINQESLYQFVNQTNEGKQFQEQWGKLSQSGFNTYSGSRGVAAVNKDSGAATDITAMMAAYNVWSADQTNTQNTWQNYATLVAQQAGGEGQSTILGTPSTALGASKTQNFNQTIIGGVKR